MPKVHIAKGVFISSFKYSEWLIDYLRKSFCFEVLSLFLTKTKIMANRRKFKKAIKNKTNFLIEDAFIESVNGDAKEAEKMDEIIDQVIDDRIDMLNKVCTYPNRESKSKIKAHFNSIASNLEAKTAEYTKKIGRVG